MNEMQDLSKAGSKSLMAIKKRNEPEFDLGGKNVFLVYAFEIFIDGARVV